MPYVTLSGGISNFQVPTDATRGYGATMRTSYQKFVDHDHTSGKGNPITANALGSSAVTTAKINDAAVTYAKIQNVATDKLLGRVSSGSGVVEEVTFTDFGQSLVDDANAAAGRTTLGLGTMATQNANSVAITGGTLSGITGLANSGANSDITSLSAITSILGSASSDVTIGIGTSNGSDSRALFLVGASAVSNGRAAHCDLYGYDHGSFPGVAALTADGGMVIIYTTEADPVNIYTNQSLRWSFEADGDLAQDATNGGSLIFAKAGTGVINTVSAAVSAAGTVIGDATQLTNTVNEVTSGTANQGVKLPLVSVGGMVAVMNSTVADIKLWPPNGSIEINGGGVGNSLTLTTGVIIGTICFRISSTRYLAFPCPLAV